MNAYGFLSSEIPKTVSFNLHREARSSVAHVPSKRDPDSLKQMNSTSGQVWSPVDSILQVLRVGEKSQPKKRPA